jgi:glycosyltransferase involved in cell wall biosynthesis
VHVCYLYHKEYPQNNATATNEFPRILSSLGVDVTVIAARTASTQPAHEVVDGVNVHRIPTDKSTRKSIEPTRFGYRGLRRIDELCRTDPIDVLHMLGFPNLGLVLHPVPWLDAPEHVVVDIRGIGTSNKLLNWISRVALNVQATLADNVNTLDRVMAESVLLDDDAAEIVPLGADFERFRPGDGSEIRRSLGLSSTDIVFGYTGVLNESRALDRMIEGFAAAHETHPQSKLVVVGDGNARADLERTAARLGCSDAVVFTGEIPFADVPEHVRAFDVGFAYIPDRRPYRIQPPLKTVEFLASGLPVLATDTPGNRRFVEQDGNGLLCPDSKAAYADAIRDLVDSPAKRGALAANARTSVRGYDYTNIVENRLLPLYERIVADDPSTPLRPPERPL